MWLAPGRFTSVVHLEGRARATAAAIRRSSSSPRDGSSERTIPDRLPIAIRSPTSSGCSLSELLRIARDDEDAQGALSEAVPPYIGDYLFEGSDNRYRVAPADVSALAGLIDKHKALLVDAVRRVFAADWPSEASEEVAPAVLEQLVAEMATELQGRVTMLHERLTWVIDTQRELAEAAAVRPLTGEEQRQRDKADAFIQAVRERHVRTYTLSVLAGQGFLPGYGLYDGGISAFPGWRGGAISFELSRPPSIAVREFVPGNMLYANRGRYRVSRYHFPVRGRAQRMESYEVEPGSGFVRAAGTASSGYASGAVIQVSGLPIADVDLALLSPIRDEENDRFQMPVTMLGLALRHRRAGTAYRFGERDVHHILGQGLRLVNVGPADRVRAQVLGYPVCIVCGACRSPYASPRELADFATWHLAHCGLRPESIALTGNVLADALHFQGLDTRPMRRISARRFGSGRRRSSRWSLTTSRSFRFPPRTAVTTSFSTTRCRVGRACSDRSSTAGSTSWESSRTCLRTAPADARRPATRVSAPVETCSGTASSTGTEHSSCSRA